MTTLLLPLKTLTLDTPLMLMKRRTGEDVKAILNSIARDGLFHPLLVTKRRNRYEVIDGKKRLQAIRALSRSSLFTRALKKIPCILVTENNADAINPVKPSLMSEPEFAHAVIKLAREGVTKLKIAKRFDCETSSVEDAISLSELNPKILKHFNQGSLSLEQSSALATIPNPKAQLDLLLQLGPFALDKSIIKQIKNGDTVLTLPDDNIIIVPSRSRLPLPKFGKTRSPAKNEVFTQLLAA